MGGQKVQSLRTGPGEELYHLLKEVNMVAKVARGPVVLCASAYWPVEVGRLTRWEDPGDISDCAPTHVTCSVLFSGLTHAAEHQ